MKKIDTDAELTFSSITPAAQIYRGELVALVYDNQLNIQLVHYQRKPSTLRVLQTLGHMVKPR